MRARLQRKRDSKFFSGWVVRFNDSDLIVRVPEEITGEPNDGFFVELFGNEINALFSGEQKLTTPGRVRLLVQGSVQYRVTSDTARIRVRGCSASVQHSSGVVQGDAVDISISGVGLILPEALDTNAQISAHLVTSENEFFVRGKVRYCRAQRADRSQFRVGVVFEPLGRLDDARWRCFVDRQAAAIPIRM
jgi:hypothetical protein